jgi:hypothetical protein
MKVESICITNRNNATHVKKQNPSFQAIHPANYFIKSQDGNYLRVTNTNIIQALQKKVISLLNRTINADEHIIDGTFYKVRKESAHLQKQRKALENFFAENDKDYATRKYAKSIYIKTYKNIEPFIVTGKTTEITANGKSISKAYQKINEAKQVAQAYYGISEKDSERFVTSADKKTLEQAKENYHKENEIAIKKIIDDNKTDKSTVNFYFSPSVENKSRAKINVDLDNVMIYKTMR